MASREGRTVEAVSIQAFAGAGAARLFDQFDEAAKGCGAK
jgi:hypothetical protein